VPSTDLGALDKIPNRRRIMMRYSFSGLLAVVLTLGCVGCGGGLQEGIPSAIDPNKPSATVKAMLEQSAAAKRAAKQARAQVKGKKPEASPDSAGIPKKLPEGAPE
jgi:hypothetical protein